jgi:hypothetical protein
MCLYCGQQRNERHAQVHASERAVVYYNPQTGEHRTPARADQPVPEVYAKQGFERREILSMGAWEKESGVVHEASNYNPGNEAVDCEPKTTTDPKYRQVIIDDIRAAIASGPWTGHEKLKQTGDSVNITDDV